MFELKLQKPKTDLFLTLSGAKTSLTWQDDSLHDSVNKLLVSACDFCLQAVQRETKSAFFHFRSHNNKTHDNQAELGEITLELETLFLVLTSLK